MNREKFLEELASLLKDIPQAEREDILQYYKDYFDDGGVENEEKIIKELGSPKEVAENIKSELGNTGEHAKNTEAPGKTVESDSKFPRDILAGLCIACAMVFLSPVFFTAISIVLTVFAIGCGFTIAGICSVVIAIVDDFGSFSASLFVTGFGLIFTALGMFINYLLLWLLRYTIPKAMEACKKLYMWIKDRIWR